MTPALNVLVTGATGLIGRAVCARGTELGWRMVPLRRSASTRTTGAGGNDGPVWNPALGWVDWAGSGPFEVVIHLAGETVARRWTAAARREIRESRVRGTEVLGEALGRLPARPRVVICASAVGYYGLHGDEWVDEDSPAGSGFLAEVCRDWEAAAIRVLGGGEATRLIRLRLGLVLSPKGGALARMLPVFRLGLGGRLGDGRQHWSWISLPDLIRVIEAVVTDERLSGAINAVSPGPVTNAEFTRQLGRALRRPTVLAVPRMAVRAAFGEMGREALLSGVRVRPRRLSEAGFIFREAELEGAFRALLGARRASETR